MSFLLEPPTTRAKDCITFSARPATPPDVRKYRKSYYAEPGQRFQHHGLIDDLKKMGLEDKIYGVHSDAGNGNAAELLSHKKLTELEKISLVKAEKVYRGAAREPLGKTVDRNIKLPDKFIEGKKAFGVASKSSLEPAKDIIFPAVDKENEESEKVYQKSHGTYKAGEQKLRDYKWPEGTSPLTTVFGNKGDQIAFNGVSNNIAVVLNPPSNGTNVVCLKRTEDFKVSLDQIGKSKNLGQDSAQRPFSMVYGLPSKSSSKSKVQSSAHELIRGRYKPEEQLPDPDLGRATTPGFRNIALVDRAFGVPSIRNDLPARPISSRSVADSQNYGDDVPAQDLINPPAFNEISISHDAMDKPMKKEKIVFTFNKIGYKLDNQVVDIIFNHASKKGRFPEGFVSCNAFRDVLNDYLDAAECGRATEWIYSHSK